MLNMILLDQAAAGGTSSGMSSIIMIVALIAIFYFFMIRPQSKKQKEMTKFRNELKKGSPVITAGGIHGRVRDIDEKTLVVEIAQGVKITVDKTMVYPSSEDAVASGTDVKQQA